MKPLRILYLVIIVASLGLSSFFYWQFRLISRALRQYQNLDQLSNEAFTHLEKKLHSPEELKRLIRIAKEEKRRKITSKRIQREKEIIKKLDEVALRQGNRGYLIKQGESTFKP